MSTGTERRLPMSPANLVIWSAYALGVVATLVVGQWPLAVVLALGLAVGVFSVRRARRPEADDVTRVGAIEYRDERDRAIARDGFAVVGVVAMVLSAVEYVVALLAGWPDWPAVMQLLVLAVVWTVANRVAAQRR